MIKVAIVGAPSTGKTTMARELVNNINFDGNIAEYVPEYARRYISKVGQPEELWEQMKIFQKQREWEDMINEKVQFIITDSPPFLSLNYIRYTIEKMDKRKVSLLTDLVKMGIKNLYSYNKIIFLRPSFQPVDDGLRIQTLESSQITEDQGISSIFNMFGYKPLVLKDQSYEEKIKISKEYCSL